MVTVETPEGWKITMAWGPLHGGPQRLLVEPLDPANPPEGGISQTLLRELNFQSTLATLRGVHAMAEHGGAWQAKADAKLREVSAEGLSDRFLSLFAWHYVSRVDSGESGVPAAIADVLGKSVPTVKAYVGHARRRGLLTGKSSRAGGELTDKAEQILDAEKLRPVLAEDPYPRDKS